MQSFYQQADNYLPASPLPRKKTSTQKSSKKTRKLLFTSVHTDSRMARNITGNEKQGRQSQGSHTPEKTLSLSSHPQPSYCSRIAAKSNADDWPLITIEDKASPWKLLAAVNTCSLGRKQEQLYLFPEVLSRKQGLSETLCLASSSEPDSSAHQRGVTFRAGASPQAAALRSAKQHCPERHLGGLIHDH